VAIEYDDELGQYVDTSTGEVVVMSPLLKEIGGAIGTVGGGMFGGPAGAAIGGAIGAGLGAAVDNEVLDDDEPKTSAAEQAGAPSGGSGGGTSQPTNISQYTIQPGDTLSAIAARFGVSVAAIANANGIQNPDRIMAGDTIVIPMTSGSSQPTSTPTQTGPFRGASFGLAPTSQFPADGGGAQSGACEYDGDGGWLCPSGTSPGPQSEYEYVTTQRADRGRFAGQMIDVYRQRYSSTQAPQPPQLPTSPGGPMAPANPASFPQGAPDDNVIPFPGGDMPGIDMPDYVRAFADQMFRYLLNLGAGQAKKVIEYLSRRSGVKRGQGANMQAACIRELTKQLPNAKKDAVRQFLCEFPGPMNLSKDGEETFLALKIAASGYDADTVCPCD